MNWLPIVIAVFSRRVLGVLGRLMMLIRGGKILGTKGAMSPPGTKYLFRPSHYRLLLIYVP